MHYLGNNGVGGRVYKEIRRICFWLGIVMMSSIVNKSLLII